jgi:hypothetical protein
MAGSAVFALLSSRHRVVTWASPLARSATDLTAVQRDVTRMGFDDQLTLSDFGEDCTGTIVPASGDRSTHYTYPSTCLYEQDVLNTLAAPGAFAQDLATALRNAPDAELRQQLAAVQAEAASWTTDENALPTLQNLAGSSVTYSGPYPRYDTRFLAGVLPHYTSPDAEAQAGQAVTDDEGSMQQVLTAAIGREWAGLAQQTDKEAHLIDLVARIPVLIAVGAVTLLLIYGTFRRAVREYFSTGEDG